MHNQQIAEIFDEIADMLEVEEGEHRFEVLAYRKAALSLSGLTEDVSEIYGRLGINGLTEIPGIGKGLAGKIAEFLESGKMSKYTAMKRKYPLDFKNLTRIQGMGSKKAYRLYTEIGIKTVDDLKRAAEKHMIRSIAGFGEKSESDILKGIYLLQENQGRMPLGTALPEAQDISRKLADSGLVERVEIAGSTRRMRETVGDIDILVTSGSPDKVMRFVSGISNASGIVLSGPTKTTIRLKIGLNCDIRVVSDSSFAAALQYFTGNKDHNVKVREIAIKKGYKLNEYGLFDSRKKNLAGKDEASIYRKLGMDIMPPEMREDRGEVELSLRHSLPEVISLGAIKGDMHVHTNHSDGVDSIADMAEYARREGREYIGITDHTKSEYIAHGMSDMQFLKHFSEIDKVAKSAKGITLLKSAEIDILKDGSLDLKKSTMEMMDYRLAAVHTSLGMARQEMTARVVKAMESGYVDILAHPTGRLVNSRKPMDLDLERVFQAAEDNGVALEIDGHPDRLDLNDENIMKAIKYKVMFSIDTDAHSKSNLSYMKYGVSTAMRGWLGPDRVINALSMEKLMKWISSRK